MTVDPCEFFIVKQDEFMECLCSTPPEVVVRVVAALSRLIRDATERLWQQDLAREKLHADMEAARHRALGQLVAGVAHELNTPLGIAHTAADLIENRCRDPAIALAAREDAALRARLDDVLEASRLLRGNVVRAHRLVESFKQVSAGQISGTDETVDVAEVVREVLDLFALNARRAHLEVRFTDRRTPSDGTWTGPPSRLAELLLNLLTNVERYAYPDGAGGAVELELATATIAGRPGVELTVRDHGAGIPVEHRAQIFEPFFTTGRGLGGTGLGLAIVHNVVTAVLGGTIRVDSEPGRGTSVTVVLPSKQPRSGPMS
jgi:signal transduction histidine kinase